MIDWKQVATHQRYQRRLAEQQESRLKARLWQEHEKRASLISTMADILTGIAYDEDDTNQEYCNVCHRSLIEEDGHQIGCEYLLALAILADAGKSVEVY